MHGWKRQNAALVNEPKLCHHGSFGFLVAKPCKTAKFFNPLNVFPMSPVFVTTPFLVQKAPKSAFFVSCVFCAARASKFARFPPKTGSRCPKSVFCLEKPANSSPLSLSPPKSPVVSPPRHSPESASV